MRVTDEESLRSIGVEEIDTVIVGTGENFAQSILITALLKKRLNIPRVIARAINQIHKDILKLVGGDQIVLPEKEIGIKLADSLSTPFTDVIRLSKDFSVYQIKAPQKFVGKTASEIAHDHHVTCVGLKIEEEVVPLEPNYTIKEHDKLVLSGLNKRLEGVVK